MSIYYFLSESFFGHSLRHFETNKNIYYYYYYYFTVVLKGTRNLNVKYENKKRIGRSETPYSGRLVPLRATLAGRERFRSCTEAGRGEEGGGRLANSEYV